MPHSSRCQKAASNNAGTLLAATNESLERHNTTSDTITASAHPKSSIPSTNKHGGELTDFYYDYNDDRTFMNPPYWIPGLEATTDISPYANEMVFNPLQQEETMTPIQCRLRILYCCRELGMTQQNSIRYCHLQAAFERKYFEVLNKETLKSMFGESKAVDTFKNCFYDSIEVVTADGNKDGSIAIRASKPLESSIAVEEEWLRDKLNEEGDEGVPLSATDLQQIFSMRIQQQRPITTPRFRRNEVREFSSDEEPKPSTSKLAGQGRINPGAWNHRRRRTTRGPNINVKIIDVPSSLMNRHPAETLASPTMSQLRITERDVIQGQVPNAPTRAYGNIVSNSPQTYSEPLQKMNERMEKLHVQERIMQDFNADVMDTSIQIKSGDSRLIDKTASSAFPASSRQFHDNGGFMEEEVFSNAVLNERGSRGSSNVYQADNSGRRFVDEHSPNIIMPPVNDRRSLDLPPLPESVLPTASGFLLADSSRANTNASSELKTVESDEEVFRIRLPKLPPNPNSLFPFSKDFDSYEDIDLAVTLTEQIFDEKAELANRIFKENETIYVEAQLRAIESYKDYLMAKVRRWYLLSLEGLAYEMKVHQAIQEQIINDARMRNRCAHENR